MLLDARLAALEEADDVTKKGEEGMAGFYASLLTKNIAMGSDVSKSAKSAYTVGGQQHKDKTTTPTRNVLDKRRLRDDTDVVSEQPDEKRQKAQSTGEDNQKQTTSVVEIEEAKEKEEKPKVDPEEAKKRAIPAARERYLARKKQQ